MGNPHAVIFVDDPAASLRELAETYGPKIEVDPLFPRRTNVEFARVRTGASGSPEIDCVVWERGVRHHPGVRHRGLRDGGGRRPGGPLERRR